MEYDVRPKKLIAGALSSMNRDIITRKAMAPTSAAKKPCSVIIRKMQIVVEIRASLAHMWHVFNKQAVMPRAKKAGIGLQCLENI